VVLNRQLEITSTRRITDVCKAAGLVFIQGVDHGTKSMWAWMTNAQLQSEGDNRKSVGYFSSKRECALNAFEERNLSLK
jgi:hypothetical protein